MKLGFIGAGNIGLHLCTHLVRSGHEVQVLDIDPAAQARAIAAGGQAADSLRAIAQASEVVFTCLPGPDEVEAVLLGADGVAAAARPGLVVVDLTTNFPDRA